MTRDSGRFRFGGFTTGDRVVLLSAPEWRGTVAFVRSGFAVVRWDHGGSSREWAAELALEEAQAA
jgi:hypothetical protein